MAYNLHILIVVEMFVLLRQELKTDALLSHPPPDCHVFRYSGVVSLPVNHFTYSQLEKCQR